MLTVEYFASDDGDPEKSKIAIVVDDAGLATLKKALSRLDAKPDHIHLMTPAWGGYELTEVPQGLGAVLTGINHLQLVRRLP